MSEKHKPRQSSTMSRRGFLRLSRNVGVAAGTAFIAANLPPWVRAVAAPEAQETTTPGFGTLPIVEGEKLDLTPYLNHELLGIIGDINFRDQPEATGTTRETPIGSVLRVDKKDVTGLNKDKNTWAGGEIVYDGEKVIEEAVAEDPEDEKISDWVATNIEGSTAYITDPNDVPDKLKPIYVVEPKGLTLSDSEYETASLIDQFSQENEDDLSLAAAWNIPVEEGKPVFEKSPTGAWQRAIALTALSGLQEEEQISQSINVSDLVDGDFECNFYRHVDKETGDIDVINRFNNPKDKKISDIFTITRFSKDKSGIKVKGVGFVTADGLAAAYGDEAYDMTALITSVTGDGTLKLAQDINKLQETKVFLAGMPRANQMAPKLRSELRGFKKTYRRTSPDKQDYRATLTQIGKDTGTEYLYVPKAEGGGEWIDGSDFFKSII